MVKKLKFNRLNFRIKVFDNFTPIADNVIKTEKDMDDFYKALKKKMS